MSRTSAEDYRVLRELFHELADRPLEECRRVVAERRLPDHLARELLTLLEGQSSGSQLPESQAAILPLLLTETSRHGRLGQHIGPYRLTSVLGEGGMGTVFLAEQVEPIRRRVALKLVKRGMDSDQVLARFEQERQVLARMDHDGIARVLDAGATDTGQPFFVMEYVSGEPITRYCDRHGLTVRERVRVFQQACHAIHHAHQKRTLHRDIKPGNVLVTRHGNGHRVKVIDFGLARALQGEPLGQTELTRHGAILGTPDYMSPEQVRGSRDQLDTRTDIYALGVLLYRLLARVLPFQPADESSELGEVLDRIQHQDPPHPSRRVTSRSIARQLRGDLDWIILKTLEKDPERRYDSATDLAADLERYLDHRPVLATSPSLTYRLRKAVRRHRPQVIGAALVLIVLMAGIVTTSRQAVRGSEQARLAQTINEFFNQELLAAAIPSSKEGQGRDVSVRQVLDLAARRIEEATGPDGRFEDEPLIEAEIRRTLGITLAELGEYDVASPHLERCLVCLRLARGDAHEETRKARNDLGSLRVYQRRLPEAEALFLEALEGGRTGQDLDPWTTIESVHGLAVTYETWERFQLAETRYHEALDAMERLLEQGPGPEFDWDLYQLLHNNLASLCLAQDRDQEAVPLLEKSLAMARRLGEDGEASALVAELNLGEALRRLGHADEARERLEGLRQRMDEVFGPDHPHTVTCTARLARAYVDVGEVDQAETMYRQALEAATEADPETALWKSNLAMLLVDQGRLDEAILLLQSALEEARAVFGEDDPRTRQIQEDLDRALDSRKDGGVTSRGAHSSAACTSARSSAGRSLASRAFRRSWADTPASL